jgi:hypothetical protein
LLAASIVEIVAVHLLVPFEGYLPFLQVPEWSALVWEYVEFPGATTIAVAITMPVEAATIWQDYSSCLSLCLRMCRITTLTDGIRSFLHKGTTHQMSESPGASRDATQDRCRESEWIDIEVRTDAGRVETVIATARVSKLKVDNCHDDATQPR